MGGPSSPPAAWPHSAVAAPVLKAGAEVPGPITTGRQHLRGLSPDARGSVHTGPGPALAEGPGCLDQSPPFPEPQVPISPSKRVQSMRSEAIR